MAVLVTNTTNWRVRPSGSSGNGGGFDPAVTMTADLAATLATGSAPVVTSASYTFVSGDIGAYVFVQSGTNWVPGWYLIVSVSGGAATVTAIVGAVLLYPVLGTVASPTGGLNTTVGCATTATPSSGSWSVDYSQQNAAQVTFNGSTIMMSNASASATVVITGLSTTVAHIGNVVNITGGTNFLTGHTTITAVTVGVTGVGTWTLSSTVTSTAGTAGAGKMGGGKALPDNVASLAQPGNTCFILGVAGNAASYPTSGLDYSTTGSIAPNSGDTTHGPTKWGSDPLGPIPTISSDGRYIICGNGSYITIDSLYITTTGTTNAQFGLIMLKNTNQTIRNCILNTNSKSGMAAIGSNAGAQYVEIANNLIYGGSTSPTLSAAAYCIWSDSGNNFNWNIIGNTLIFGLSDGILNQSSSANENTITNNIIYKCVGNGINDSTTGGHVICLNTIDANGGSGLSFTGVAESQNCTIINNIITNQTGTSKSGIAFSDGSATLNNFRKKFCDYNVLYNNTANYLNISAGAHDQVGVNPLYVNEGVDFTPTNTALAGKVFPGAFPGTGTTSYAYPGAVQPKGGASAPDKVITANSWRNIG